MTAEPTVFIVDDDAGVRDSLISLLDSVGMNAESFGSSEAFLGSFDRSRSGCLLLDVFLPEMSGLELQTRLAEAAINLPIIVMTGFGDVSLAVQAMKAGAVDFIEKPPDPDTIVESIRRALALEKTRHLESDADRQTAEKIAGLTSRERDVFDHLVIGQPNKIIAYELGLSTRTVEHYRARVMSKMEATSLSHLVRMALAAGLDPKVP